MDSINDFIYRGTRPKPMAVPSPKRISTPAGQRLSTILENQNATAQPSNRSEAQRFIGTPPRASEEKRPPSYSSQEARVTDAERAAFANEPKTLRERIGRRGGWKRFGLIVGAILLVVIALAVGLGVGLTTTNSGDDNNDGDGSGSGSQSHALGPFPAGAWTFNPFLLETITDCTPIPETWSCYPYTSYSESTTGSETPVNWVIRASESDSSKFTISSSSNPWAPTFRNKPLLLKDENTPNERYTFTMEGTSKQVFPNVSLTDDNTRATCFYNSTSLEASIYTRKPITLFSNGAQQANLESSRLDNGLMYKPWAHAMGIEEVSPGGTDSPQCFRFIDSKPTGNPIDLETRPASSECHCTYQNF